MSAHDRTSPGEPDDPGLAGIGLASFRIAQRARRKATAVVGRTVMLFKDGGIVRERWCEEFLPHICAG